VSTASLIRWTLLAVIALISVGCFRSNAQDQFYMLQPVKETSTSAAQAGQGPLIGLGPIKVPAYLDRPQIVTASSAHEYRLAENQRWAERLDDNIARVTQENLAALIPTDRIVMHPWSREIKPDLQVSVQIQELHVDADNNARMVALWSLKPSKGELISHRFTCSLAVPPQDFGQIVAAESDCLARLNREMAQGIRQQVNVAP
jgi:uncharacterized lipoprotein YmbA